MLSEVVDQIENKGRQEGILEGRRATALRMLRKGYPLSDVMEMTELSRGEIELLLKDVEAGKKAEQGGSLSE